MRKFLGTVAVAVTLLVMGAVPAQAEAPSPSVSSNVTDKTNKIDESRIQMLVKQVQDETDYELYVYITDNLSGMSGAQWAVETANKSGLNSVNAVLFVIATEDRLYGSAYPTGSSVSSQISTVEAAAIPKMKEADWTGAMEAYGNKLISASHASAQETVVQSENTDKAVAGFFGVLTAIVGIIAGLGILGAMTFGGNKLIRRFITHRKDIKDTDERIKKFNATLPGAVTKVDSDLNAVNERVSFFSVMHGEKVMEPAVKFANAASMTLQTAITYMGEAGASKDREVIVRALKYAENSLRTAKSEVKSAQAILDDLKSQQDGVTAKAEELSKVSEKLTKTVQSYSLTVADLKKNYDADYVNKVTAVLPELEEVTAELATVVANISPETDFPKASKAVADGSLLADKASKLRVEFIKAITVINEFDAKRNETIVSHLKALRSNEDINDHKNIKQAYVAAVEAVEVAKNLDVTKGNPQKALEQALRPVSEYLSVVKELRYAGQNVATSKKVAVSILSQKWGEIDTLVKNSKEYRISSTAEEQERLYEAVKLTGEPFKALRDKVEAVDAYDVRGVSKVVAEINTAIEKVNDKVSTIAAKVARVEAQLEAERRQRQLEEEARRKKAQAEEAARRKRQQEEEEARRKKRRDEEASRRRRSSSSSSSYSSYGGSYGGGYGGGSSGGSSFSGSGGSFGGDSGSGGSF